ncbi:MAG: hypothetical protein SV966_10895 [Actinomycetota bacterium]|nr:hypothetical protein [Actinomycetota bacterium]
MMHYGANNYGKQLCALAGAAVVFALLGGCAEDASSGRSTTTTTSRAASGPSDAAVASAAEKMLRDDAELKGQLQPGQPFLTFECGDWILENSPEDCWEPWLNGFSFEDGELRIRLQVDRSDPFSNAQAARAALWFRNYVSADRGILRDNVDSILVTDGTGTEMARQQALRR